jgi:uncharacterized protein
MTAAVFLLCAAAAAQTVALQELAQSQVTIVAPAPAHAIRWAGPLDDPTAARDLQRLRSAASGAGGRSSMREAEANWVLGLLALHGIGMAQDPLQALSRFQRARQLGFRLASAGLAWCAIDGCDGVPEPAAGRRWVAALRASNPARALYLEWVIDEKLAGLDRIAPRSPRAGAADVAEPEKLVRAAQAGDAQALLELGFIRTQRGMLDAALAAFRSSASASPAAAANAKLISERLQAQSESHEEPTGQQLYEQARRFHRGEGVPPNYAEAIKLYRQAADQGSVPARRMLQMILNGRTADGQINIAWVAQLASLDPSQGGGTAMRPVSSAPALQRDPTALYDLVPERWRRPLLSERAP